MTQVLRGNIVHAPAMGRLDILEHGCLVLEDGVITGLYPDLPAHLEGAEVRDFGDRIIMQSFADMHLHAPQYPMMAMGMDLPLLDWLEAYAFPTRAGVTGYVGKVNMDRNGLPGKLQESTEESVRETLRWLDACHFEHIKPILTPRFTPSCTNELMTQLGKLANERGLYVQSHRLGEGAAPRVQPVLGDIRQVRPLEGPYPHGTLRLVRRARARRHS